MWPQPQGPQGHQGQPLVGQPGAPQYGAPQQQQQLQQQWAQQASASSSWEWEEPGWSGFYDTENPAQEWQWDTAGASQPGVSSAEDQQEREEEEAQAKKYQNFSVGSGPFQPFWDLIYFPRHFQRAQSYATKAPIASKEEHQYLTRAGITRPVLINLTVWRRSVMTVLFFLFTATAGLGIWTAYLDFQQSRVVAATPPITDTYEQWAEKQRVKDSSDSFIEYSKTIFTETQRLTMGQADVVLSCGTIGVAALDVFAMLLVSMALMSWDRFQYSRKKLVLAWCVTVFAPFVGSLVPARIFVDWGNAETVVRLYHKELTKILGASEKVTMLQDACTQARDDNVAAEKIASSTGAFGTLCGVVEKLPEGSMKVPNGLKFWNWIEVDFAPMHAGCAQGQAMIDAGQPEEALEQTRKACDAFDEFLGKYLELEEEHKNTPQIIELIIDRARVFSESMVSLMLAFFNVKTMFPAALSLAPGLLRGAVRMKMLVPQSIIPGMLVLILPWMSCPLAWCMYSIGFQIVGNVVLLFALLVAAFAPTTYFIVGWWRELVRPMPDKEAKVIVAEIDKRLFWLNLFVVLMALIYVFEVACALVHRRATADEWSNFGSYDADGKYLASVNNFWTWAKSFGLVSDSTASLEGEAWGLLLNTNKDNWQPFMSRTGLSALRFIVSYYRGYFLSIAAGLDWMVGEMVRMRQLETKLEKSKYGATDREEHTRMDALVGLDEGKRVQ